MATRAVGGGERYVGRRIVSLSGVDHASVKVPQGADLARIQPNLFSSRDADYWLLIGRGVDLSGDPIVPDTTAAFFEVAIQDGDVLTDCFPAAQMINLALVDDAGTAVNGGANDLVVATYYTNLAGRLGRKGAA